MEKILNQILSEITGLKEGQARLETRLDSVDSRLDSVDSRLDKVELRLDNLEKGQQQIQKELRGVWDDILRIDKRISAHDEELEVLKRLG